MDNRIKELREANNLSQDDLGEKAGTTGQQIGRLEKGKRKLTQEWMSRLAPHLKVTPDELLPLSYRQRRIKISGVVQAGPFVAPGDEPEFNPDEGYITVPLPEQYRDYPLYALRVNGPSMNRLYADGAILICCHLEYLREEPVPNKRYIVRHERPDGSAETTVKEFVIDDNGRPWLWP